MNPPPRLSLCILSDSVKYFKQTFWKFWENLWDHGFNDPCSIYQWDKCTYVKLWLEIITRSSHLSVHTLTSARGQVINNLPASPMLFKIFFPTKYYISVREHLLQRQKMRFRQICAVKMHKCGLNYAFMHKSSLTKLAVKFSFSFSHDFEFFDTCQLNMGKDRDRSNWTHYCISAFLSSVQTIWLKLNVFAENQLTDIHSRRGTFFQLINQLILYWHLPPSLIFQEVPYSFSMLWLKNTVLSHGIKIIQCSGNSPICLNLPYIFTVVISLCRGMPL